MKQQEKTLKSEIALLRSKLANCETELLQCKNKIRLLLDEIQIEQRNFSFQCENRQQIEKHLLNEVDRLQEDIEVALHTSDNASKVTDNLKKDVAIIENSIAEKKKVKYLSYQFEIKQLKFLKLFYLKCLHYFSAIGKTCARDERSQSTKFGSGPRRGSQTLHGK